MPDREYPAGALEALRSHHSACVRMRILDLLAAMSPEDRAALAQWVWPEGRDELAACETALNAAVARAQENEVKAIEAEADTVQRITEWVRNEDRRNIAQDIADLIERKFGRQ